MISPILFSVSLNKHFINSHLTKWEFMSRGHLSSNIHVRMFGDVRYFFNIEMLDVRMLANIQMFESSKFGCSDVHMFSTVKVFKSSNFSTILMHI